MATEPMPGNSHKSRIAQQEPEPEDKKIEKVVEGTVIRRKKSFGRKILDNFIGSDDTRSVASYIAQDIVVPAVKDLISDAVVSTVERVLFGDNAPRRGRGRSYSDSPRTNYNGITTRTQTDREPDRRREMSPRGRERHDFDEIVLSNRVEADRVIEDMYECLSKFGTVTVADLYGMVGLIPSHVDRKWGWEGGGSLSGARAARVRNGFLLDLPQPEYLN